MLLALSWMGTQVMDGPMSFTILSNGALLPDIPGYHTADFVYPVGYKGLRTFPSMQEPTRLGDFEFEIRYGGIFPNGGPLFCVRQFDCGEEMNGITPDEVWGKVVDKLREAGYQWKKGVNGHALFGLTSQSVVKQLETLPGIEECAFYKTVAQLRGGAGGAEGHVAGQAGVLMNKADQDKARLLKLQEHYLQKQEQLTQRLDYERKREEAKEKQRLQKERQKALIELQREQQRLQLDKSREQDRVRRAEAEAKRKLLMRAHGRQVMIDDLELISLRQQLIQDQHGAVSGKSDDATNKIDSLEANPIECVNALPEGIRRAEYLVSDLLEVWELVDFFGGMLKCSAHIVGNTFVQFCERLEDPRSRLFHYLHVVLVHELFKDLGAADTVFLGRPLNALTWPELLRQYLEMVMLEHEEEGLETLSLNMRLEELCETLQTGAYEELSFQTKLQLLLTNFHLAMEGRRFRLYLDAKQEKLEIATSERKMEFERLRRMFVDQQSVMRTQNQQGSLKIDKPAEADEVNSPNPPGPSVPATGDSSSIFDAARLGAAAQLDGSDPNERKIGQPSDKDTQAAARAPTVLPGAEFMLTPQTRPSAAGRSQAPHRPISQVDGGSASEESEEEGAEAEGMGEDYEDDEDDDDGDENLNLERSNGGSEVESSADDMMVEGGEEPELFADEDGHDEDVDQMEQVDLGRQQVASRLDVKPESSRSVFAPPEGPVIRPSGESVDLTPFVEIFVRQWCEMTNQPAAAPAGWEYEHEEVDIKGAEGDVAFKVHEMYWSVQSFGGSCQMGGSARGTKWKLAANDMLTRKTGRPGVPVPGRGYSYMPKAWEKWRLSEYEHKFGTRNLPPEYQRPAFVATRKSMLQAAGLAPGEGRKHAAIRRSGGKVDRRRKENGGGERKSGGRVPSSTPRKPRPSELLRKASGASRRSSAGLSASLNADVASAAGRSSAFANGGTAANLSPGNILLLKLLESNTLVRGLSKEEVVIKRAVDLKHVNRLTALRCRTEPLGIDRFRRKYWIFANDFSVIWVQGPSESDQEARAALSSAGCTDRPFSVMTSAVQVNRLLKGLDSHGIRENDLLESLHLYRDQFAAAMGGTIDSIVSEDKEDDTLLTQHNSLEKKIAAAALDKTLASMSTAPIPVALPFLHPLPHPSTMLPHKPTSSGVCPPAPETSGDAGHWEKDAAGNRTWVGPGVSSEAGQQPDSNPEPDAEPKALLAQSAAPHPGPQNAPTSLPDTGDEAQVKETQGMETVVSWAARFLDTAQPVLRNTEKMERENRESESSQNENSPSRSRQHRDSRGIPMDFSQHLYAQSDSARIQALQDHFGIDPSQYSAKAAQLRLPNSLCQIKGDLLLIEMAVSEEAINADFMQQRATWIESVRDATTPMQLMAAARKLIENLDPSYLHSWYKQVLQPWDERAEAHEVLGLAVGGRDGQEAVPLAAGGASEEPEPPSLKDELPHEDADNDEMEEEEEVDASDPDFKAPPQRKVYAAGDVVEAKAVRGYRGWWEATIVRVLEDRSYEIKWARDPQIDLIKKPSEVRQKKKSRRQMMREAEARDAQPWIGAQLRAEAERQQRIADKEEKAPVSIAKVAIVVYGFDEAVRYSRASKP